MSPLKHLVWVSLFITSAACTTILTETTGDQGMQEDPYLRTAGTVVEDESIETKVAVNMRSQQPQFRQASFNVTSHNGIVLLVGQVQTQALKEEAARIAAEASVHVRRVHNELEVAGSRSLLARSNDAWLATKVRTQLAANDEVNSNRMRVVANNGTIYLMGIVDRDEGNRATSLARNVGGVTRVVSVFEYL
ncbi:BON domain-containing protein [Pseudohongiella spirulinae]|uniref:Phospholipid-binding protein n=1 Tax=Pseudohongiella spirulinae TaxID=1249552 RepID=A0A0S2KFQ2_9GAMM|nr:BON domain-containing protein [Pseudohongiella spirulinae]ALO46947.1 phospholipid-binding protein [Pseudohongiella spirulinae]